MGSQAEERIYSALVDAQASNCAADEADGVVVEHQIAGNTSPQ